MMRVIRSILAVLVGSIAIGITALGSDYVLGLLVPAAFERNGQVPGSWVYAVMLVYSAGFSGLGGYVTARLAPGSPMAHVLALAVLQLVGGLASAMQLGGAVPAWFQTLIVMLPVPVILLGGKLYKPATVTAPGTS